MQARPTAACCLLAWCFSGLICVFICLKGGGTPCPPLCSAWAYFLCCTPDVYIHALFTLPFFCFLLLCTAVLSFYHNCSLFQPGLSIIWIVTTFVVRISSAVFRCSYEDASLCLWGIPAQLRQTPLTCADLAALSLDTEVWKTWLQEAMQTAQSFSFLIREKKQNTFPVSGDNMLWGMQPLVTFFGYIPVLN